MSIRIVPVSAPEADVPKGSRDRFPMTPVDLGLRGTNLRNGQMEIWSAISRDGVWGYERTEENGTPWHVTHLATGRWVYARDLSSARRATAHLDGINTGPASIVLAFWYLPE